MAKKGTRARRDEVREIEVTDRLAVELSAAFGDVFVPDRVGEIRDGLVKTVANVLPRHDVDQVTAAFELAVRRFTVAVNWRRFLCVLLGALPGWWTKLTNSPGFGASTMLLLTDGTVMCQEEGGKRWKRLRPDHTGSYVHGAWSDLAPMHWTRRYYASAVLADGRVFVSGGEYGDAGSETNKTEIYQPSTDTWTEIAAPAGWNRVGDAACAVLPDGRLLLGNLDDTRTAIFDPATDTFSAGPAKGSSSSEESWALLPDETVITVRCDSSRRADKYVAAANAWVDGGTLPTGIVEIASSEIGPAVLLNDGRAFFAGANGHTALYTPPALASGSGTWSMGPDFPDDIQGRTVGCKDTPACLLTNGKVLIAAGPVDGIRDDSFPRPISSSSTASRCTAWPIHRPRTTCRSLAGCCCCRTLRCYSPRRPATSTHTPTSAARTRPRDHRSRRRRRSSARSYPTPCTAGC